MVGITRCIRFDKQLNDTKMTTATINPLIAATKEEAVEFINELLTDAGESPLRDSEVSDWGIKGGETFAQLEEWTNDYLSECHTEKCAAKNEWRYQH